MKISTAQALWKLGHLPAEKLPDVANRALKEGLDGQALRELAGLRNPAWRDAETSFERALREVELPDISRREAGLQIAKSIATEIITGAIEPYDGARKIWGVWEDSGRPDELAVFVGLASEYEDDPKRQREYNGDMVSEAKQLIGDGKQ